MTLNRLRLARLTFLGLLCLAPRLSRAAESVDTWLCSHPDLAAKIVWEFPPPGDAPPAGDAGGRTISSLPVWTKAMVRSTVHLPNVMTTAPAASSASGSQAGCCGGSCPLPLPPLMTGARRLSWIQWDEAARQKLRQYYGQYSAWLAGAWPLYAQYRDGGFSQKPQGFAEKFEPAVDPDVQGGKDLLPFAATALKDSYTQVLYDSNASFDLVVRNWAFQLALEIGDYLPWSLLEDEAADQAATLSGDQLFHYFPAGSHPWGGAQVADHGGHLIESAFPAPPLTAFRFLVREGILRSTRFETVSQWLEWERSNLHHTPGTPQDTTGQCGTEYHETIWGVKGAQPASRILLGWSLTCPLVKISDPSDIVWSLSTPTHWTGGCGTTAFLNFDVLRQINIPDERVAFSHGQSRFVVEKAPFREMMNALTPLLPAEPAIDDGLSGVPSTSMKVAQDLPDFLNPPPLGHAAANKPGSTRWEDVYLDHNDDPYGFPYNDVPAKELLIPPETYDRWFKPPPANLTDEQRNEYMNAHSDTYVSLRIPQLVIAHLPQRLLSFWCWYDAGLGRPHGQTKTYMDKFSSKYTVSEIENFNFWGRLEQKLADAGGCGEVPPLFQGNPPSGAF